MGNKKNKSAEVIDTLQSVHYLYEKRLDRAFSSHGISNEQFRILSILETAPADGIALKSIQSSLPNQTANTTRLVEKLNQKKYVTKKSAPKDKRELRITLTEGGIRALQDARAEIKMIDRMLRKTLKNKNSKIVLGELKKLQSALD